MDQPLGSRYMLHEMLGRGAMGQVYRASMRGSETPLAVKLLKPELVTDPELVARFIQERSILTSISHPNVVQIFDLVVEGDTLGIVMELIAGQDLRHHLRRQGTLPPAEAAGLTRQILHGIAAVHAAGIIHRDIKPENLLLDTSGGETVVKLTDFGVARISYGTSLTKRTSLIGTPEYMAPELADGGALTPAADLYSVGIMLYEMLGGETPFAGGHPLAVLRRHVDQPPAPIPGIPYELWDYVDWLLAKDPGSRPGSATDAAAALMPLLPRLAGLAALPPIPAPDPSAVLGPHPGMVPPPATTPAPSARPPRSTSWPAALGTGHEARPMTAFPASDGGGTVVRRRDRGYSEDGQGTPVPGGSGPSETAAAATAAQWAAGLQPGDSRLWDQASGGPGRGASLAAALTGAGHARPARGVGSRPMVLALPAAVVVLAAAIALLVWRPHSAVATPASSPTVTYAFPVARYSDGLTIVRHWTLSGHDGSLLTETVTASSSRRRPVTLPFEEVVPTGIASNVRTVLFTPAPEKILRADPLVEWRLRLPARPGTVSVGYRATVPADGLSLARLRRWAAELKTESAQLHLPVPTIITLSSLSISPGTVKLSGGSSVRLALSGQLAKGGPAPKQILAGAAWTVGNTAVATVSSTGLVTAIGPGTTRVTAEIGSSHASISVRVTSHAPALAAGTGGPAGNAAGSEAPQPSTSTHTKKGKSTKKTSNPKPTATGTTGAPVTSGPQPAGTETVIQGDVAPTASDYSNDTGSGPSIGSGVTVDVTCKVTGMQTATGNAYWYKIASSPWGNSYYAPSQYFYNDGQTSGQPNPDDLVNPSIPNC